MSAPQLVPPNHPALWSPAREVTAEDRVEHQHTIKLMREAIASVTAPGLAAPQLGLGLRFFVTANSAMPVVINPTWEPVGTDYISKPERSLSRPNFSTYVRRPARIHATWTDADGTSHTSHLSAMDARVFMHLADMLDGSPIFPRASRILPRK